MLTRYIPLATNHALAVMDERLTPTQKDAIRERLRQSGQGIREYAGLELSRGDRWDLVDLVEAVSSDDSTPGDDGRFTRGGAPGGDAE